MEDEIQLSPVTGWDIKTVPSLEAVFITFGYLSIPTQKVEQAHRSQNFLMSVNQLRDLRDAIQRTLLMLESGVTPADGHPKH